MTTSRPTVPATGPIELPLSAATATPAQRATGIGLMLGGSVSNQAGAALGAMAFPAIGPVGVVAVRQLVTAIGLVPVVRPSLRGLSARDWRLILGLVLVFSVMNLSLYSAVERIGLGLAVTLEFVGPLGVAIAASRRRIDLACTLLAAVGVVVLTRPGPSSDLLGIGLALLAAAAWAAYILLNRAVGQRLPGLQGTALASLVTAGVWIPIAVAWFATHPPTVGALALAAACGLLSSVLPYALDMAALRRVPANVFGTLTSVNPAWAALAGWLMLGQVLDPAEWLGIGLIVGSNLIVSLGGLRGRRIAGPGRTGASRPRTPRTPRRRRSRQPS
ncbi:EamA family transporter [Leucobacter luti]|uniref:EamA family transporter n=1 Tax=Leucobacter luti TaxID=340320 RepID=UPI003D056094